jgi:hypothetical protein
MNDADIDFYLSRILSGYLLFFHKNERYELRYPSLPLKYEANLIYNNIINDEKYNDWIREENAIKAMIFLGLWTDETEIMIQKLDKTIDNLKVELYNNFLNKSKHPKIRESIRSYESQKDRLLGVKQDFVAHTLEGYAASVKNEYIISQTLYKDSKLVFKDISGSDANSYQYFNSLVQEINSNIISVPIFKSISRSGLWRSYWNANKNNILKDSVINWTDEQRSLINITKMYDSVYEHPECPDDKVIEDDDMLDGWMIVQKRKINKQKKEATLEKADPRLRNAQEVFIIADGTEEAEEILEMNSLEAKMRLKEKFAFIDQQQGPIDELQLPDVRRDALASLHKK